MKNYTKGELDRKIKAQELICLVNRWLLEHYQRQRMAFESISADRSDTDIEKDPGPRQSAPGHNQGGCDGIISD